jgi:hypothetical protein
LDRRGFEIDGENGEHKFQIWFLPLDWLGIRIPRANRLVPVYWEGVLAGNQYKIITDSEDGAVHRALDQLPARAPSLVNVPVFLAGYLFKDRIEEVDANTQALVRQFCHDEACLDEAARSLIVLGVPARGIILDRAEHGTGAAQEFCVSVLGNWKWPGTLPILIGLASDPATPPQTQKVAAWALESIGDPSSGPALALLLHNTEFSEAAAMAAEALGRIRYEEAAPAILSWMVRAPNEARFAQALASLRYKPGIANISILCQTQTFSSDWILAAVTRTYLGWLPEIALMRLTGAWGPVSDGVRLLLLSPSRSLARESIKAAVVIENIGVTDLDILASPGHVIVDGRNFDEPATIINGNVTLRINDVAPREIDLSHLIKTSGDHRIEYRLGTATSNMLILRVP